MNEVLNAIFNRRSIRAFQDKKLDKGDLDLILKAAAAAPTAMNGQPFGFVALTNSDTIAKLAALVGEIVGRAGYNFYKPAALIIPYTKADAKYGMEENACAIQNIYLAAYSLGLGCVLVNQIRDCCGDARVREMLRGFGIPDDCVVYGAASVGYAAAGGKEIQHKAPIAVID